MIQIAFEPAYDPFHAAFRIFRHTEFHREPISAPRLRILDVFLVEPSRVREIRVPNPLKPLAKRAAACQAPIYGRRPSTQSLFNRMRPMQEAALQTLAHQGFLEIEMYREGLIERSNRQLPDELQTKLTDANEEQAALMDFLHVSLADFPYDGANGLKDRTKLGEFRYDVV